MIIHLPKSAFDDYLHISNSIEPNTNDKDFDATDETKYLEMRRTEIRQCLASKNGDWPYEAIFRLRKIVELAVHANRATEFQWALLWEICNALDPHELCAGLANTEQWLTSLQIASTCIEHKSHPQRPGVSQREFAVGNAILALERDGYECVIDGFGCRPTDKSVELISKQIENKIKRAGGMNAVNGLLILMNNMGRVHDGSLLHARKTSTLGGRLTPSTPWHYIYALSIKHLATKPKSTCPERDLKNMEKLAVNFAASLDVEPFSSFENMHVRSFDLFKMIRDTLIYDELFAIPQWQCLAARFLVPELIVELEAEGVTLPLTSGREWTQFFINLLSKSHEHCVMSVQACDIADDILSEALAKDLLMLVALPAKKINRNYVSPGDNQNKNYHFFPLFLMPTGEFAVQPKSIMARAFCERILALLRDGDRQDIDNKMGDILERLTSTVLRKYGAGPTVENGKYQGDRINQEPELDRVVEQSERIFFIECTKKSLTAASRRSDELSALKDLEGSFIKLIKQLAGHEARLANDGHITLLDGRELTLEHFRLRWKRIRHYLGSWHIRGTRFHLPTYRDAR